MPAISERNVIAIVSGVQFINVLDFMMVMPLGPDFAEALDVPISQIGVVGGSYTAAAALSGFACSFFLDKFDRRRAMLVSLTGLVLGTIAGGFAINFTTLLGARVLAGIFGGPASALSLAIVADLIPPERRGKAMGAVMGAFSIASVLGVPAGLELAHLLNWQLPFFALGAVGLIMVYLVYKLLPELKLHFNAEGKAHARMPLAKLLRRKEVFLTYLAMMTSMTGAFLIIPNIASYVQINLNYPREHMGLLYMAGGVISFFVMRIAGVITDKKGAVYTSTLGTVVIVFVFYTGFYHYFEALTVMGIFIFFMTGMSLRNVAYQTFASKVPRVDERAGFLSLQSTVQHLSCALGAFMSSQVLYELPDKKLGGMENLAITSMVLAVFMPVLLKLASGKRQNWSEPTPR